MDIVGRKIRLGIDEPWDSSKVIDGEIIGMHRSAAGKTFFLVEDALTGEKYVVSSRYEGDDVKHVFLGEKVIVAIARPKTSKFYSDDPNFLSNISYYGIGSIESLVDCKDKL